MATYYVRKTGDDGGDGSTGNPWLTIEKAIATIPTTDAHTCKVGDGVYDEDSGNGYLYIRGTRTGVLTIEAELGSAGDVTIRGASAASYNVLVAASGTCQKLTFRYIDFAYRDAGNISCVGIHANATAVADLTFDYCTFTFPGANGKYGFYAMPAASKTIATVTFTYCTFVTTEDGHSGARALYINCAKNAGTCAGFTFTNCTVTSNSGGVWLYGVTGITLRNNVIQAELSQSLVLGPDAYDADQPATTCAVSVSGNNITNSGSHTVLIGCNATGFTFERNNVVGGDIGVCVKNASSIVVQHNTISANATATYSLYCKASSGCAFRRNLLINDKSGGYCFYAGQDAPRLYAGVVFANNTCMVGRSAYGARWDPDEEIGTTSTSWGNHYILATDAVLASFDGADKATIAALQAAWNTYGNANGDAGSRLIVGLPPILGQLRGASIGL